MGSVLSPDTPVVFSDPINKRVVWESHPGPQSRVLRHRAFEILYGGARGGGKSAALIAWLAMGNRDLPDRHPCRFSYLNHPRFRALVLRRNAVDLKDFIQEAAAFFRHFGGKKKDNPPEFHFGSGAIIYMNHLESEDAFDKYRGWNLVKVGIEELTLIESESAYLSVLGSVRSPDPDVMRAQVFCTTNPDGNGSPWVRKRFVQVMGADGKQIPWGTTIRDPFSGKTRVFIPAKLRDNPSLGEEYLSTLRLQDEKKRRAWIDGDWNTQSGLYFSSFRPNGPLESSAVPEPEWARHVIKAGSVPLMSWWPRYIGCDWGYKDNAAAVWLCNNQQDERLHVYDELVRDQVGSEHLGVMIAERTLPALIEQPDLQIPLYLSHDAFAVRDETKTTAELIQRGIASVLGEESVVAMAGRFKPQMSQDEIVDLPTLDSGASVVIQKAGRDRISVWQHIRSLLRFDPIVDMGQPNPEFAQKLLEGPDGFNRYEAYLKAFERKKEVLPGILFWDNCTQLIDELGSAIHDDKKPEDILDVRQGSSHMDALQALRHVIMHLMKSDNPVPYRHFIAARMNEARGYYADPVILAQVARKANSDYQQVLPMETGRFLRSSSRERLM